MDVNDLGKVPVKFLASHAVYVRGDIAGFEPALADALVKSGVATEDLTADLGGASAGVDAVAVAEVISAKDAEIAELKAQLAAASAKPVTGKASAKVDADAGSPPMQGGGQ